MTTSWRSDESIKAALKESFRDLREATRRLLSAVEKQQQIVDIA